MYQDFTETGCWWQLQTINATSSIKQIQVLGLIKCGFIGYVTYVLHSN